MIFTEAEERFVADLSALYDKNEAKEIYSIVIEHLFGIKKSEWRSKKDGHLSPMEETSILQVLDELSTGKPLQYVLGETMFYGARIKVNPDVLIPRPETEELVAWVISEVINNSQEALSILDIGTGSGCIPIALKMNLPDSDIHAIDISHHALETAMRNAVLNKAQINFMHGDILDPAFKLSHKFDVIVSNPPYIKASEKNEMHRNVLDHEPHLALFVEDDNALIFYERIAEFAQSHLKPGGMLFFEINEALAEDVATMLKEKSFKEIEVRKDMQGKDRMVKA
jgi:release factor glutamine methyltransferase